MASDRIWRIGLQNAAVVVCAGLMTFPALAQQHLEREAGGPASPPKAPRPPAAASGLNDMLQVPPAPVTNALRTVTPEREHTSSPLPTQISLAERLRAWNDATRRNAQLQVELPASVPDASVDLAREIEALWSTGQYDWAIAEMQDLEGSGTPAALGVSWRTPRPAGTERSVTDVRIGTRTGGAQTALDFDAATGKLFAAVRWDTDNGWALYQSATNGESWDEIYFWNAGAGQRATDVDLVVVANYVYVGYVASNAASEARLRRIVASTGQVDNAYSFHTVLDGGTDTITDIAITSDADWANAQVYYAARQSNNAVRYAWDVASDGTTFTEVSPAGVAAIGGLDLCGNPGFATYYAWLSYIGTDSEVHVWRRSGTAGWNEAATAPFDGTHNRTTISAWDDHVICAHELQMTHGQGIRYFITHDGGETWDYYNYVGEPLDGDGPYQMAEVTARGGAGTAIVFTRESGEPDDVLVRYRRGYAPGLWHRVIRVNSNDVSTGTWTALNWTPRDAAGTNELSYGSIYFYGSTPYFDRFQRLAGDVNCDGVISFADINAFVLAISSQANYEAIYPDCDFYNADCSNDGVVSFADINPFVSCVSHGGCP